MPQIAAHIVRDNRGQYYASVDGTLRRVTELEHGKFTDAPRKMSKAERKREKREKRRG